MALEKEMETFKRKLPELKDQEGKYVLIKGDEVKDIYSSYEDAVRQGYRSFGMEPFLVKQIQAVEKVQFISRHVQPGATVSAV